MSIGIHGIGLFLPPEIRRNDFWPEHVTRAWMEARPTPRAPDPALTATPGAQRIVGALAEQARDPFQGAVARHIMPEGMALLDMEEQAAALALSRAGCSASAIDLLLTNMTVPDFLLGNPAAALHQRLGMPRACFSMHTDIGTHSFMMQLVLAASMIEAGRARTALVVQSCAPSRILEPMDVIAPFFGDAATAAVVAAVPEGRGIEASVTFTDGRFPKTLIASVPGRRWYDEGRAVLHVADPAQTQAVFLGTADACKEAIDGCLRVSGRTPAEIDFLSIHQGTPWLRRVVQDHAGLSSARTVEMFTSTAYLFASTIPASLAAGEDQGLLRDGDRVMLVGGGPGQTFGAVQLVWGRG